MKENIAELTLFKYNRLDGAPIKILSRRNRLYKAVTRVPYFLFQCLYVIFADFSPFILITTPICSQLKIKCYAIIIF